MLGAQKLNDHKTKQMGSALKFLTCYAQEGDEFLDSTVTGDEKWDFQNTPQSKQVTAMVPYAFPQNQNKKKNKTLQFQ